jgi:ABC-type histidine transport system ATPase subunit
MTAVAIILACSSGGTATATSPPRAANSVARGKDIVATIPDDVRFSGQLVVGADVEELVREVLSAMRRPIAKGVTTVVMTREFGFILEVAKLIVLMHAGRTAGRGAPAELLGNPRQERAQASTSKVL